MDDFQTFLNNITAGFEEFEAEFYGPASFYFWVDMAQQQLTPEQYALLLEALPIQPRKFAFQYLSPDIQKQIFLCMQEEARLLLIKQLELDVATALLDEFDAQSLLELAEELPDRFINEAYKRLDESEKALFERAAKYPGEQAGHWVNFDLPTIYHTLKISSTLRLLKRSNARLVDKLFIQDKQGLLVGEAALTELIPDDNRTKVQDAMQTVAEVIPATLSMDEAAARVISSGHMALPVVDDEGLLLGRLTLSTAYEHREETAEQQISVAGGLTEDEDLFAPVWRSSRNRAVWLGINLLTAFLASWCIGLFEATLQQVVALAILMPVVASMGGISGSQTLTVIVRALALGKITDANRRTILKKELRVGLVNGVLWAVIIALCVYQWFGQVLLGVTIALAILINIVVAVVSGVLIPAALDRLKIDPALSGSVILTTVTDVVGFVVFLGAGSLILA